MKDSPVTDFKHRLLLLNTPESSFPEQIKEIIKENSDEVEVKEHEVELNYALLDYYQIMRQILPLDTDVPQPLERIGHITSFYLTDKQYPYKAVIAEVWMDKNPDIKTIVNRHYKDKKIVTEHILGDKNTKLKIQEGSNLEIILDYLISDYTTRMEDEHKRILQCINMNYTICDLFADCGDVTIRAAKKGCKAISNCEDPVMFSYLQQNVAKNLPDNTESKIVAVSNKKTEEFIKELISPKVCGIKEPIRVNVIYISDFFNSLNYIKEILKALRIQCEDMLNDIWNIRNLPKVYFYYGSLRSLTKPLILDTIKQIFTEAGCSPDSFTEKHIIGLKENQYVYPGMYLYCIFVRIPAAAVFNSDYMDMYGGLAIQDPSSIYNLSIGNTLEVMNDMRAPMSGARGKRQITELTGEEQKPIEKKKKFDI